MVKMIRKIMLDIERVRLFNILIQAALNDIEDKGHLRGGLVSSSVTFKYALNKKKWQPCLKI